MNKEKISGNSYKENGRFLDERIIRFLSKNGRPVPSSVVSFMLSAHPRDVCEALRSLEKYGRARVVSRSPFGYNLWTSAEGKPRCEQLTFKKEARA